MGQALERSKGVHSSVRLAVVSYMSRPGSVSDMAAMHHVNGLCTQPPAVRVKLLRKSMDCSPTHLLCKQGRGRACREAQAIQATSPFLAAPIAGVRVLAAAAAAAVACAAPGLQVLCKLLPLLPACNLNRGACKHACHGVHLCPYTTNAVCFGALGYALPAQEPPPASPSLGLSEARQAGYLS
eukprot:1142642-Pelagomonas_calceolata.AAC.7